MLKERRNNSYALGTSKADLNGNISDENGKVIEDYHSGGCSPDW